MKRKYQIQNLGCANCAAKMEDKISKLEGIKNASLSFITQSLHLEIDEETDVKRLEEEMNKIICSIEPDCRLGIK